MTKSVVVSMAICSTLGALVCLSLIPIVTAAPAEAGVCDGYPKKVSPCTNYKSRCLQVEKDATKCKDKARACRNADWSCRARDDGNMWSLCCSGKDMETSKEFLSDYNGTCMASALSNETNHALACTKGDNNFDDDGTPMPVRMKVEHHDTANTAVNTDMLGGLKESFDSLCYQTGCSRKSVSKKYKQDTTVYSQSGTASVGHKNIKCSFEFTGSFRNDDFKAGAFQLLKSEFSKATEYTVSNVMGYGFGKLTAYKAPTYVRVSIDEDDDDQHLQLDLQCQKDTTSGICSKVGRGIVGVAAEAIGGFGWSAVNLFCAVEGA